MYSAIRILIPSRSCFITLRDHLENIIGGGSFFFCFSPAKSGHTPQRTGRIWVPPPSTYMHIKFFNNTPRCVLWSYLRYFKILLIISIWQNLHPPRKIRKIWAPPSKQMVKYGCPPQMSPPPVMFSEWSLLYCVFIYLCCIMQLHGSLSQYVWFIYEIHFD